MEPMTMMAIMAAAQGLVGVGQSIMGSAEAKRAERNFKKYEVPQGIKGMLGILQSAASQRELPGADIARSQLASATSRGVETAQRTASSSSDVLGALHKMYSNQMDKELSLAIAGAQNYQQNQARLAQGLQTLGGYQTQKWQYNELYPYMQRMTAAGQLRAAGGANIAGALQSGVRLAGAQYMMNNMETPYGGIGTGTDTGAGQGGAGDILKALNYGLPAQERQIGVEPWMADPNFWPGQQQTPPFMNDWNFYPAG